MLGGFNAGSIFITLGGQTARAGFDEFVGQVGRVSAFKDHHIRLGGDFVKDGFERYARAMASTQAQTNEFATASERAYGRVSVANRSMADSAVRYTGLTRQQLGYTAKEYETVAAAAQHSADSQRAAAAEGATAAQHLANENVKAAKRAEDSWKKGFNTMATVGKWSTAAAAIFGVVGVKMAADFNRQMELLTTQAGYSQKQVDGLKKSVLDLGPAVGESPTKLAEGMYHLASSGIAAKDSMQVLTAAAQGAKIGNTDLESTANSLVHTLDALRIPASRSKEVMGDLINIVGQGDMRMQDLNKAMGSGVLSAAHAFGLGLKDVGAALDTLTTAGVPAEQGANRLRTVLGLIENPTKKADAALAQLHITHTQLAEDMRTMGLPGMLADLQDHMSKIFGHKLDAAEQKKAIDQYQKSLIDTGVTGKALDKQVQAFTRSLNEQGSGATKSAQLVGQAFGGARMGTTMQILITQADEVQRKFDYLGAHSGAITLRDDWAKTQKQFSVQVSEMWAGLQRLLIQVGEKLIPVVQKAIKAMEAFGHWLGQHKAAADALAIAIGTFLTAAVASFIARFVMRMGEGLKAIGAFTAKITGMGPALAKTTDEMIPSWKRQQDEIAITTAAIERQGAAAAGTTAEMGRLAATGEAVSAGGVIIPGGVSRGGVTRAAGSTMTAAEREAIMGAAAGGGGRAAGGILGRIGLGGGIRSGLAAGARGLGAGAMRASPYLFAAPFAAPLAEGLAGAVGIHGDRASRLGHGATGAALGAGVGTLIEPGFGTAIGAGVGFLGGALGLFGGKKSENDLQKFHDELKGMKGDLRDMPVGKLKDMADRAQELEKRFPKAADGLKQIHDQLNKVVGAKRDFDVVNAAIDKFSTDGKRSLGSLTDRFRTNMRLISTYMGDNTERGKTAVERNVSQMVAHLGSYLDKGRINTNQAMTTIFKIIHDNTGGAADDVRANFGQMYASINKAWHDGKISTDDANKAIRKMAREQSAGMKSDVEAHYKQMFSNIEKQHASGLLTDAEYTRKRRKLHGQMAKDIAGTEVKLTQATGGILTGFNQTVETAVGNMGKQLNRDLKALGLNPVKFSAESTSKQLKNIANAVSNIPQLQSLQTIGQQYGGAVPGGEFGHDDHMILIDPHGNPRARMAGDEWVFSGPQQPAVEAGLQLLGYTDVHDFWDSNRKPHTAAYNLGGALGTRRLAAGGVVPKVGMDNSSVVMRANFLNSLHLPYVWGGHHGDPMITDPRPGLDCSSTVSYVLGIPPRVSGGFENFGKPGPGPITLFANPEHVWMTIGGRPYGTSAQNPKGGPGWIPTMPPDNYISRFVVRHVGSDWTGLGGTSEIAVPQLKGPDGAMLSYGKGDLRHEGGAMNRYLASRMFGTNDVRGQPLKDGVASVQQARSWIDAGMALAGVHGAGWENMLLRQASRESSFNPGAINRTDINAAQGNPSEGFLQVTLTNFAKYMVPGHANILNAVDNTAASVRYIIDTYGKGNAAKALSTMIARGGGAYATGGALGRKRVRNMHAHRAAHSIGAAPKAVAHAAGIAGTHIKTPKNPSHKLTHALHPKLHSRNRDPKLKNVPVLPHKLLKLGKFSDLPGVPGIDEADQAIKDIDTKYGEQESYFNLVDATLTSGDLGTLLGLRQQQGTLLATEQGLVTAEGDTLDTLASDTSRKESGVRERAGGVLRQINLVKRKLTNEGRKLARLRHTRAGAVLKLADKLAKQEADGADKLTRIRITEKAIRDRFRKRLADLHNQAPADPSDQIKGIRSRYKTLIDKEPTTAGKNRLTARRDGEIQTLTNRHKAEVKAHSKAIRDTEQQRDRELNPYENERIRVGTHMRHLREQEGKQRRKWSERVWSGAWQISTDKWKLQDKLQTLENQEKALTGSKTEIGKGGLLGEILKEEKTISDAQTAQATAEAAIPGELVDNALSQLDLADQQAQAQADSSGSAVDVATLLPPNVQTILEQAGIAVGAIHRVFQPTAGATTGAATGPAAVLAEMAALDSATQQLLQQFGSNFAAPGVLGAALAGAGTVGAPGVRFFGAAGPGLNEDAGLGPTGAAPQTTNNFNQTNHFATGPQDPHIYAQSSKQEFNAAFG